MFDLVMLLLEVHFSVRHLLHMFFKKSKPVEDTLFVHVKKDASNASNVE